MLAHTSHAVQRQFCVSIGYDVLELAPSPVYGDLIKAWVRRRKQIVLKAASIAI